MLQLTLLQSALEDGVVFDLLAQSVGDLIHLILESNVFILNTTKVAHDVTEQLLLLLAALLGGLAVLYESLLTSHFRIFRAFGFSVVLL